MNFLKRFFQDVVHWFRESPRLRRIFRDNSYLFSSNVLNMGLGIIQSSLSASLLGVYQFGLLGIITDSASTINNLFSFRMGELIVKYLGDHLEDQEHETAGALVKAAAMIESSFAILAFVFLYFASPLLSRLLAKDASLQPLFVFYGLIILSNLFYETAYGVVQVLGRFRGHAIVNSIQSVVTAVLIVIAFVTHGGLEMVLLAYLVGKIILGLGPVYLAIDGLNKRIGSGWWKASLRNLPHWKELLHFGLGSNFSATVNMIVRDSELLWVSFFLSPAEAGYYKVAMAINRYLLLPINPFIQTTYPEINRHVKNQEWQPLRKFLRRITTFSGAWTGAAAIGLALFGRWVILLYAGEEFLPAYGAMLILLVGYGLANTFFWNRSLLLSFGDSLYAFLTMLFAGGIKIIGAFFLVPSYGYLAEAWLFASFFVVSVALNLLRGRQRIRRGEIAFPSVPSGSETG
ncbi:MAG: oligosaccharide flippase family protein [Anaerolineae bacterium]|nr:oligosaccharide flippase family protein [Anaerolineae bacterium]